MLLFSPDGRENPFVFFFEKIKDLEGQRESMLPENA